jgi:hypothetical protein
MHADKEVLYGISQGANVPVKDKTLKNLKIPVATNIQAYENGRTILKLKKRDD